MINHFKMEGCAKEFSDSYCLVEPKKEILDDLNISYDIGDNKERIMLQEELIIPKEELPYTGLLLNTVESGTSSNLLRPIKIESTLSEQVVWLQNEYQKSTQNGETFLCPDVSSGLLELDNKPELGTEAIVSGDYTQSRDTTLTEACTTARQSNETSGIEDRCDPKKEGILDKSKDIGNCASIRTDKELLRDVCLSRTVRREDLVKHMESHRVKDISYNSRKYSCGRSHMSTRTTKKPRPHENRDSVTSVTSDLKTHTGSEPYSCDVCYAKFALGIDLCIHMRTHIGEIPYACKYCDRKFSQADDLRRHIRSHTCEKPYSCTYCDCRYTQASNLKIHMRSHTGEKPYSCHYCGYKASRKSNLKYHIRSHTGEKPHFCKYCDYKSSGLGNLRAHMSIHTGEKPNACEFCDYKTARKKDLKTHMSTHTRDKSYTCNHCDFKCSVACVLVDHKKSHNVCEYCGHKSSRYYDLKIHMRSHTGTENPYSCRYCDFKCSSDSDLKVHLESHAGDKPYYCKHCDYRSSKKYALKIHTTMHTGEKPYSCEYCDYKSPLFYRLKVHMRTHDIGDK